MRTIPTGLCLVLLMGAARAGEVELAGRAALGPEARAVTLRLACRPAAPGLSAALVVPRFADLGFPFDAFEGPTGATAPLTALLVSGPGGVRSARVPASGAVAADPATSFTLTVAGASRGQDPLRALAPGLAEPGARLTWTQASPRPGAPALTAVFPIPDAAGVRAALEPCFGR